MKIELINPSWQSVFLIGKGEDVIKGRHGVYHDLRDAGKKVTYRFGCYSWQVSDQVCYCGSFTKDNSRSESNTNLEGRLHGYWQNHKVEQTGRKNTNKHVFDLIKTTIASLDVSLNILRFDTMILNDKTVPFEDYIIDPEIVRAVEALAICHYRTLGQCTWNRT